MISSIEKLVEILDEIREDRRIVVTSGGFDPIHPGHIFCIQESAAMKQDGVLVVVVNGDGFLVRKKGKPFMNHDERMVVVDALRGVDYVVGWDDGSQTVVGALELLKPHYFTKGGDRSEAKAVPEFDTCAKIGCKVVFGVGGTEKAQSSSDLIANAQLHLAKFKVGARVNIISYVGIEVPGTVTKAYAFSDLGLPYFRYVVRTDRYHRLDDVSENELRPLDDAEDNRKDG